MLLVVAGLVCAAGFLNPHPHAVLSSQDAIATAYADWSATVRETGARDFELWEKIYSAKRVGSTWMLIPNVPGARYKGEGTHITVDAKTGCVIKEISFD